MKNKLIVLVLLISSIIFADFSEEYRNVRYQYTSSNNTFRITAIDKNQEAQIDRNKYFQYRVRIKYEKNSILEPGKTFENEDFRKYMNDAIISVESGIKLPYNSSYLFSQTSEPVYVSGVDTSSVIDMSYMFYNTDKANPDVSRWDVSKVEDMSNMFSFATNANPDVSNWNVKNVRTLSGMFMFTDKARPNFENWDLANAEEYAIAFEGFNQYIPIIGKKFFNLRDNSRGNTGYTIIANNAEKNLEINLADVQYRYNSNDRAQLLYYIKGEPVNFVFPNEVTIYNKDKINNHNKLLALPKNSTLKYKGNIANIIKLYRMVGKYYLDRASNILYEIYDISDNKTKQISYYTRTENILFNHEDNKTYIYRPYEYTITDKIAYVGETVTIEDVLKQISRIDEFKALGDFSSESSQGVILNNVATAEGTVNYVVKYKPNNNASSNDYEMELTIPVRVISFSNKPTAEGSSIGVSLNHTLTNEDAKKAISNNYNLPKSTEYTFNAPFVDTSTKGSKAAVVRVKYQDGTYEDVNVTVLVGGENTLYNPEGQDIEVQKGYVLGEEDAKKAIKNIESLPSNVRYSFKNTVDTSTSGNKSSVVVITYEDGTYDEVEIKVNVLELDVNKYKAIINSLNTVDISAINYDKEGIYLEGSLLHNYYNKLNNIVTKNSLDGRELFSGIKAGYNYKINERYNVGGFIEYDYDIVHKIGLGLKYSVNLNNQDILGFIRYRINFKDEVSQHNMDLYTRYTIEYTNKYYVKGIFGILLSYGSKTQLDELVSLNQRVIARLDAGLRLGMNLTQSTKIYVEPLVEFNYTSDQELSNEYDTVKIENSKDYFNGRLSLGLDHTLNKLNLGESISFDTNGRLNAKVYLGYKF